MISASTWKDQGSWLPTEEIVGGMKAWETRYSEPLPSARLLEQVDGPSNRGMYPCIRTIWELYSKLYATNLA